MDTLPSAEPGAAQVPAAAVAPEGAHPAIGRRAGFALLLALAVALLALGLAIYALLRSQDAERRLEAAGAVNRAATERADELARRVEGLEREWAQVQADAGPAAAALGDADIRRRREQLALIDVERLVEQAQMQLRLGSAPAPVIDALAAADEHLGRIAGPAAQHVQAALRRDVARLRAAPNLDRGALAARLDPLMAQVDSWHMTADPTHAAAPALPAAPGPRAATSPGAGSWGARARQWINQEFGDLLRVREVDAPAALLIGPGQQQLVRDRVRLDLLDLRQAILARDERVIRAELETLTSVLNSYFDPNQPEVAAALALLHATGTAALSGTAPSLEDTLAALRAARAPEGLDARGAP